MILKGQTKLENYIDFQDVEPKNPVKGQKYYDGEKVQTWNGSEWKTVVNPTQLGKDVASAVQAGESAGEKADEAKTESEQAVESANSAVDKANGAAEDAGFAKNTANEAKSESSEAVESANNAVNKANDASTDAGFAKDTANEAKSTADKASEQASEAKSSASKAIEDAKSSLEKSDSNEKTITDVSKTVDTVKGELSSKVNQTDYDTLKGTVSDQSTSIKQNAKDIKLKANSQDVDTINQTVKSHGTEISQNAKAIKTKAEQSNVDNVSGKVETLSTTVEQQAGRIETVSSKTDGNTTAIGKIESSYDGLKSTVSEVKDDVETAGSKISTLEQNLNGFKTTVQNEKADQSYVDNISGEVESISTTVEQQAGKIETVSSKTDGNTTAIGKIESSYDGLKSTVSEVKDDVETAGGKISTLEQNLSGFKSTVQNEKADKSTVTQLADQWQQTTDLVDGHTSQISSLGSDLNLRVEKDDVINQINVSDEGILIDGKNTWITGDTKIDNAVIDTAHIKDLAVSDAKIASISADKLTAGSINTSKINVVAKEGQKSVKMTKDGFTGYDDNGKLRLLIGVQDLAGDGKSDPSNAVFYSGNGKKSVSVGTNVDDTFVIGSENSGINGLVRIPNQLTLESKDVLVKGGTKRSDYGDFWRFGISTVGGTKHVAITTDRPNAGALGDSHRFLRKIYTTAADIRKLDVGYGDENPQEGDLHVDSDSSNTGRVWSRAFKNQTFSGSSNAYISNAGIIGKAVSARKYKKDIQEASSVIENAKKVLQIFPSSWIDKAELKRGEVEGRYYGFIADDFYKIGLTEVVQYDEEGDVEGLAYDRISMYHNVILKDHDVEINQLKDTIKKLKGEINKLKEG